MSFKQFTHEYIECENYGGAKLIVGEPYWVPSKKVFVPKPVVLQVKPKKTEFEHPFDSDSDDDLEEKQAILAVHNLKNPDASLKEDEKKTEIGDKKVMQKPPLVIDNSGVHARENENAALGNINVHKRLPAEWMLDNDHGVERKIKKSLLPYKHKEKILSNQVWWDLVPPDYCGCKDCADQCKMFDYPTVAIPYYLKPNEVKKFIEIFKRLPHCVPEHHDHALAAAVRHHAQLNVENYIYAKKLSIVDIYGSCRLPSATKWCKMPLITAADYQRVVPSNDRWCRCEYECVHSAPDVGLFVDVVYYLTPMQIASHCINTGKCMVYSLHHSMQTTTGSSLAGTYRWTTEYANNQSYLHVSIGPEGTENRYTHPDLSWLTTGKWSVPGGTLTYVSKGSFGPMSWGVFQYHLASTGAKFLERQTTNGNFIEIESYVYDAHSFKDGWQDMLLNVTEFLGLKTKYEPITVKVPADLFAYLARTAMFIPEREKAVPLMLSAAKRWFNQAEAKGIKISPIEFAKYLPHCICAALVTTLPDEIGAMHYHMYGNDLLQPGLWRRNPHRIVRICLTGGAALFGFLLVTHHIGFSLAFGVLAAFGLSGATGAAMWYYGDRIFGERKPQPYRRYVATCLGLDQVDWPKHVEDDFPLANAEQLPCLKGFTDDLCGVGYGRDIAASRFSKCIVECKCLAKEMRPPEIASFFVTSAYTPLAFTNCTCNVYAALRMRWMRQIRPQNRELWSIEYATMIDKLTPFLKFEDLGADITPEYIDHWLSRYHLAKQERLKLSRFDSKTKFDRDKSKFFCKRELLTKEQSDIKEPDTSWKPRGINAKDPGHQMITGPSMHRIADHLVDRFDGQRTGFIYACKRSPDEVGVLLQKSLLDKGLSLGSQAVECDLKMCETTMRGYFIDLENAIYKNFGISEKVRHTLFKKNENHGTDFSNSIHYSTGQCRESGATNTSVGNTIVYASILYLGMLYALIDPNHVVVVIGGDDCVLYYDEKKISEDALKALFHYVSQMGLEPELIYHKVAVRARFYSGYFLPFGVRDSDDDTVYCHVPMIGKAAVKSGTMIEKPGLDPWRWLLDTATQRKISWAHIPVLRAIPDGFLSAFKNRPVPAKKPANVKLLDSWDDYNFEKPLKKLYANDETYHALGIVYDVTEQTIRDLDSTLVSFFLGDWIGKSFDNPVLKSFYAIDTNTSDWEMVPRV